MPLAIDLQNLEPLLTEQSETKLIKAPIARLGKWKHDQYGTVSFDQKDFDDIVRNWRSNVTGFEPPLYLGHPTNSKAYCGEPAIAFLSDITQQDDTLFGLYEPVDENAFKSVSEGKYRYASCEVYRNAKNKETGELVGTVLTAHALTNEPFLTKLPRVAVTSKMSFSNPINATRFIFCQTYANDVKELVTLNTMTTDSEQPAISTNPDTSMSLSAEQFVYLKQENETLRLELADKNSQLQQLQLAVDAIKQELSSHTERVKKQELADKLDRLNRLNISTATKEKYSQLFSHGGLDTQSEENIFSLLEELSNGNVQKFSEVKGNAAAQPNTEIENPYTEALQKLSERARQLGREFVI